MDFFCMHRGRYNLVGQNISRSGERRVGLSSRSTRRSPLVSYILYLYRRVVLHCRKVQSSWESRSPEWTALFSLNASRVDLRIGVRGRIVDSGAVPSGSRIEDHGLYSMCTPNRRLSKNSQVHRDFVCPAAYI